VNKSRQPCVGIFYLVGRKLFLDTTPTEMAGTWGEFAVHEPSHQHYWEQLTTKRAVPDAEYEEYPRGRVGFNRSTHEYLLLADACILSKKSIVKRILRRMNLPARTKIERDSHYRCSCCMKKAAID